MKKVASYLVCAVTAVSVVVGFGTGKASAFKEFKEQFDSKYVPANPSTPEETAFKGAVESAKCGVCHEGPEGKNKKKRNAYGASLEKLINKGDKKNAEKIQKALDEVAGQHSVAGDEKSPTFGELIKSGKLPAQ